MPTQTVETVEVIADFRQYAKRTRGAPSDQSASGPSNRGSKLESGAETIHEGWLGGISATDAYKEQIEYAGYTRRIVSRNPRRYNEDGDELDDSEPDEEADAGAVERNAYGNIQLEELLCPLKQAWEVATHPTLSQPYLSTTLPDMVATTQEKLRRERENLWRAKALSRQMIGDAAWVPARDVEAADDWDIFEPQIPNPFPRPAKRKRADDDRNHHNGQLNGVRKRLRNIEDLSDEISTSPEDSVPQVNGVPAEEASEELPKSTNKKQTEQQESSTNIDTPAAIYVEPEEEAPSGHSKDSEPSNTKPNGVQGTSLEEQADDPVDEPADPDALTTSLKLDAAATEPGFGSDEGSPPPPPRRITRALAANSSSTLLNGSPPLSPAISATTDMTSGSQLGIHPLYLVNSGAPLPNLGAIFNRVPPDEVRDTRRMLMVYVQKQEESVRGYEAILDKLLLALRLRGKVLEMCKAEEHVGQISDGEDWIDAERWGLQPGDLKKGRDDEEQSVEENMSTINGRKGRRRARN